MFTLNSIIQHVVWLKMLLFIALLLDQQQLLVLITVIRIVINPFSINKKTQVNYSEVTTALVGNRMTVVNSFTGRFLAQLILFQVNSLYKALKYIIRRSSYMYIGYT